MAVLGRVTHLLPPHEPAPLAPQRPLTRRDRPCNAGPKEIISGGAFCAGDAQLLHSGAARVSSDLALREKRPARLPSISPTRLPPTAARRHDFGPGSGLYTGMSSVPLSHVLVSVSHNVVCKNLMYQ